MKNHKALIQQKIAEWTEAAEKLSGQLNQTGEEIVSTFEKQKKDLLEWIDNIEKKLEDNIEYSLEEVKGRLAELRLQAVHGKAETQAALQQQERQLRRKVKLIKTALAKAEKQFEGKSADWLHEGRHWLNRLETQLEVSRWKLMARRNSDTNTFEDRKEIIARQLKDIIQKTTDFKYTTEFSWEDFKSKNDGAWNRLRLTLSTPGAEINEVSKLHFDHRQWQNEIQFWEDELAAFEHHLEQLVGDNKRRDKSFAKKIEHYQNIFDIQCQEISKLEHEALRHEIRLAELAREKVLTVGNKALAIHLAMSEKMATQRKLFQELRTEYFQFLKRFQK